MSSAMVHLTCAKLYDPDAPTLFYTGNIIPDLLYSREEKDVTHFRHLPPEQRMEALLRFAEEFFYRQEKKAASFGSGLFYE